MGVILHALGCVDTVDPSEDPMNPYRLAPLLLLLPACLENEEEIEVRPDGSVRVTVSAKGDVADLADGYPVPLPGWELLSEDAGRWVREVGPDTGGGVRELRWAPTGAGERAEGHLVAARTFGSVDELPRWFAPEGDPYRTAYLERSAALEMRDLPGRRVFVFERTFHGFERERLDLGSRLELPQELERKLADGEPLTPAERGTVAELAGAAYEDLALAFARDALLGIYTRGDGGLPAARLSAVLEAARSAARGTVTPGRLFALLDALAQEGDESGVVARMLEELEADWRAALRTALGSALLAEGVGAPTRNAALYALEWQFAAFDHSGDLGDESFEVRVRLPGTLVGGNYEQSDEGVARWKFDGSELHAKDVVLRAVSVLELGK